MSRRLAAGSLRRNCPTLESTQCPAAALQTVFSQFSVRFPKIAQPEQAQKSAKSCTTAELHAVELSVGMKKTPVGNLPLLQSLALELYPKPISAKCYAADLIGEQISLREPPFVVLSQGPI